MSVKTRYYPPVAPRHDGATFIAIPGSVYDQVLRALDSGDVHTRGKALHYLDMGHAEWERSHRDRRDGARLSRGLTRFRR